MMGSASAESNSPISGNADSQYVRTHKYTKRLANAHYPNISYNGCVPPPMPHLDSTSHCFQEGEFISPGFFQRVDLGIFDLPYEEVEWSYSLRRSAQPILPFLYLGPWSCLSKRQWIREEGFTLLLGVRDRRLAQLRVASGQKAAAEVGIQAESFDIVDNQDLISRLPQVIRHINDHVSSASSEANARTPKKVLVFCETGNGLSALVVVAYLMVMFNMGLSQAINFLHSQRFCIDLEESVKPLLGAFEGILEARRDVEAARRANLANSTMAAPTMSLSRKRSFADRVEEDDAMDDRGMEVVEVSAAERKPLAPFQDRWA
ncbi:protein-tyrosine phosphatase-like protein [Aspergillus crustosus]